MLNYTFSLVDFEILILILVRISCFVYAAPFFGMKNVPSRVKIGLSFLLSILIFPSVDQSAVTYTGMFGYAVIVLREGITGLLMGFAANICNSIILFAGNIIDMDIGLSMATEFDPINNAQVTLTGNLYNYFILMLLVVTDMHHYILRAFVDAFTVIPVNGQVFDWEHLMRSMTTYMGDMFVIAFRIILPVFACIMILNCILGIMAKVSPQMNMFAVGMQLPIYASKTVWIYIIMAYLFLASVMPMWLLMQPRDYMTTFMLLGMIIGAVLGVVVAHPDMELNAFNGFQVGNSSLFPTLFVTIACGAVSGFHSLVSSGTSSKTVSNEKDMPMVGYGAMIVESLLGVVALVVVGAVAVNGTKPDGTPFSIFSSGVAGFLEKMGVPVTVATVFMTMCVSALALTSLDSVARIGRMSFQELFLGDTTDTAKMTPMQKVLTNKYFATVITLFFGYLLTLGGYNNVWPLFGSANQLLAALVLIALAVFLKTTGRTGWTLYFPMGMMLVVTFTALIQKTIALVKNVASGQATFLVDGLQLIVAVLLMVLGVMVAYSCIRKLFGAGKNSDKEAA